MKSILRTLLILAVAGATSLVAPSATAQHDDIVETAVAAGQFNTLATALTEAGLVETLKGDGPFTVFAPTDAAFANLPAGTVESLLKPENRDQLIQILTYHVVPGSVTAEQVAGLNAASTVNGQQVSIDAGSNGIFIDDAEVTTADIMASNGVIHVIDAVILPETKTIPEVASAAGQFETLLAAVKTAGLAETLMGEGPFTVFAPTDAAFASLPAGTVESLLKPENRDQLTAILTYHVVSGRAFAADALELGSIETLAGETIEVNHSNGRVLVNEAEVISADIDASNGVIHVVDGVLLPPSPDVGATSKSGSTRMATQLPANR